MLLQTLNYQSLFATKSLPHEPLGAVRRANHVLSAPPPQSYDAPTLGARAA
jgi:hypothetical protein